MPRSEIQAYFVTPKGSAAKLFREVAEDIIEVRGMTQFDNTRYSYYRGFRWIVMLREMFFFPFTVIGLLKAKRKWQSFDLVHINESTGIVPLLIAKWLFGAPVIVHVRSLARDDVNSLRTRWVNRILRDAQAVVAIDENVRASLPSDLPVEIIHNSFTYLSREKPDQAILERMSKLRRSSFKVGFVGNLLRVKGLFDLVEAARIVKAQNVDVEYLIVGDNARSKGGVKQAILDWLQLSQDIKEDLMQRVCEYGLEENFHFLGFTLDIQSVYEKLDVLCFPSHYDAPGRPIFEAAFSGIPSIVAVRNPCADTLVDWETGLAVPPKDPEKLAGTLRYLATHPEESVRMGQNAKRLAQENFDVRSNGEKLLSLYTRCAVKKT